MSKTESRGKSRKSSSSQRGSTATQGSDPQNSEEGTSAMESLEDLFAAEVGTLLLEQKALLRKLPELADAAPTPIVRQTLRLATAGALVQAERLECLCLEHEADETLSTHGAEGLIDELAEHAADEAKTAPLKVIAGMRRILRVHVAACGSAAAHAKLIGDRGAARLLHEMTADAECADGNLLQLCESGLQENLEEMRCDFESELSHLFQRRPEMANYGRYRDDDYEGGRGYDGRSSGRYDDDDRGYSGQGYGGGRGSSRYDDDEGRFGGQGGRSYGGRRSSQMQERDEYGQFAGYGGGRSSSRYDDDRGYSSRGRGSSSRYEYDDDDSGYGGGGRGGYTDSAGRHYSRESWERAQEGRSRGGQHSHSGSGARY